MIGWFVLFHIFDMFDERLVNLQFNDCLLWFVGRGDVAVICTLCPIKSANSVAAMVVSLHITQANSYKRSKDHGVYKG